ncbi:LacI family DNA-binding transcriptional regulator [Pseudonocardia spinosispora]|uniref:LacI family DNA-binding transcriptional regulator n=1 Tax=Pseudonocardia spinosispora TaxID=103441 RepID=UPI0004019BDA|nr:LacI family DNA-binding transcriptional regulator [Pseudonocardia spinosispora]
MTERPPSGQAVTILDVARLANVSRATASRALGDYGRIGAETRQRVLAAAEQLRYRPNELARAMRAGKTLTIGLVVAEIGNTFHDAATRAIVDTAAEVGYQVLVANTNERPDAERQAVRVLIEKRVDGLIVIPCSSTGNDHLLSDDHPITPMVLLDRRLPGVPIGSVTTDDRSGSADAVRHLLARGHRDIGALIGSQRVDRIATTPSASVISTGLDRAGGVTDALLEAGLPPRPDLVRYSPPDREMLVAAASELLALPRPPTAVVTSNTDVALAVAEACRGRGVGLGVDLSLVSFDDAPWAALFTPALSVLARPVYELGRAAVELLVERIADPGAAPRSVTLPTTLIDRASVATLAPPVSRY